MATALLLDFDGVIRHFSPQEPQRIAKEWGIEKGALERAAFEPNLLKQVVTGAINRAQWIDHLALELDNPQAASAYLSQQGHIDHDMLALIRSVRRQVTVHLGTNASDTLPAEIEFHGLQEEFDSIFNSSTLGFAKPDQRFFQCIESRLDCPASEICFVDDQIKNVRAAANVGMDAVVFKSVGQLEAWLSKRSLLGKTRPS